VGNPEAHRWRRRIAPWEIDLVRDAVRRAVARGASSAEITDAAAFESDLMLHLRALKRRPPAGVRSWEAHLKKAVRNKIRNWIRDHPVADQDVSLDAPLAAAWDDEDEPATRLDRISHPERNVDILIRFGLLLERADPWLALVYKTLLQTGGNLSQAAIRLRVRRATIRAATRRMAPFLKKVEFGDRR